MGSCCSNETMQNKDVNMQKNYQGQGDAKYSYLFDDKEILGLRGADKIYLIIKI